MDRISGVSLPMHPSYHVAGLLHELDPATRREAWFGAINTIYQINKLPWREDFGFLHNYEYGATGLDAYLGWLGACGGMACQHRESVVTGQSGIGRVVIGRRR